MRRFQNNIFLILVFFLCLKLPLSAEDIIIEVQVRPGDTLHNFAEKYLKDPGTWPQIFALNKNFISDPNKIYPNQIIKIPQKLLSDKVGDIVSLRKDVKIKKYRSNAWEKASLQNRLFEGDGIKTGKSSYSKLDFLGGGNLDVGENSLVYLKTSDADMSSASILTGVLRSQNTKIITPSAQILPRQESVYDVDVDSSKKTKVSVRLGEVDVKAQGKVVRVVQGFGTIVEANKAPGNPVHLPLSGDEALDFFDQGLLSDNVVFRVQVAKDRLFRNIIKTEDLRKLSEDTIKKDLKPGKYFWKLAVIDSYGFLGEFSKIRSIMVNIVRDDSIKITAMDVIDKEKNLVKISGVAKGSKRVIINGYPCAHGNAGEFEANITLPEEEKLITITVISPDGVVLKKYHKSEDGRWYAAGGS